MRGPSQERVLNVILFVQSKSSSRSVGMEAEGLAADEEPRLEGSAVEAETREVVVRTVVVHDLEIPRECGKRRTAARRSIR